MNWPLQITYRNVTPSGVIEEWIRDEADKLDIFYNQILRCRVAIELPHRHHRKGSPYHLRIDLAVPGGEIVVKREPSLTSRVRTLGEAKTRKRLELDAPHKMLRRAIKDAFKAAGRRLQDYGRRQRGAVKIHEPLPVAHVSRIFPLDGYGFLTSADGREIYFHKHSVLNDAFDRLTIGTAVSFVEEPGENGPQATTVRIGRKHIVVPTNWVPASAA
jgi:cold shock CspA family protein